MPPRLLGEGSRLVLAHGFTQNATSWGIFGAALSSRHRLICVDLPGHGSNTAGNTDLDGAATCLLEDAGPEPFHLLGYSLGGRVALHAALKAPSSVRSLILIGASAGIDDPDARAARRARDDAMADELDASGDVASFIDRWLSNPMFADLGDGRSERSRRLTNSASGLASSLRGCGVGTQRPLWHDLSTLEMPVLALAGACDIRFSLHASRIAQSVRYGLFSLIPGANHAAHLAQPTLSATIIECLLDGLDHDKNPTMSSAPTLN